ncbi:MAG: ABC transporter ATP-binding protein [Candidatus Thermoplasmatota archaeon]
MEKEQTPVMKIRDLTKKYGDVIGIKDLDLDVYKGEIMGFLGPNGAGKTTTIRTCLGLLNKTSGDVKIFGLDSHGDSIEIRRKTGYLPGDFGLYPNLKVKTILKYLLSLSEVSDESKMKKLSEQLELDLNKNYGELSSGNRQKVGIVQAFMADPNLIILDEPTSGLDPLMQQKFYEILRREKEEGKTIFMSSHILAEVEEVCDRVAIIRNGERKVVEHIETLKDKMGKKLVIDFEDGIDPDMFEMEGVEDIQIDGSRATMIVTSNLDEVIKRVSKHNIVNMSLETFSLDQLFLTYYSSGGSD